MIRLLILCIFLTGCLSDEEYLEIRKQRYEDFDQRCIERLSAFFPNAEIRKGIWTHRGSSPRTRLYQVEERSFLCYRVSVHSSDVTVKPAF